MFVVLAEINCLSTLNKYGIYPDRFYTDFELFRSNMVNFVDATVLVIFAGSCRFNKRQGVEVIKIMIKRIEDTKDNGISHVYVVSDTTLPGLKSYYKYENNLQSVDLMSGWNKLKSNLNIWRDLKTDIKETQMFLSDYDKGKIHARLPEHNPDDDYIKLIKIPTINLSN